ncbi:hypothetical protein [Clostridiisalibacter paucivorans]|uniref:hypothetical protein n=1 Tax=Clostridiisalibacter paucivorans TaxID=408753 RepID=UPI00047D90B2|nr:hypothetical protein [Clostridiisalibacter paucivorans]
MKKRLNIDKIQDKLAVEMWGDIKYKYKINDSITIYNCEDYNGYIFNDIGKKIDKGLINKLNPMVIIEKYSFNKNIYYIERTDNNERIPEELQKKYNSKRYDERIRIYGLCDESMSLLEYYHPEVLTVLYKESIDNISSTYKSISGYRNRKKKDNFRYIYQNAPEFVKKKDRKRAKSMLREQKEDSINNNPDNLKEIIEDRYEQIIEILS